MHIIAVNIDVTIPIDNVIAKPLTGPVPITYNIKAAINVVTFASKMVINALEKPSRIAVCGSLSFNSSRMRANIKTLASTAIPTVRTMPAMPGKVNVAPSKDIIPVIKTRFINKEMFAAIPKTL